METPYQYLPLPAHDWIRLLRLDSQEDGGSITICLTPHRLDDHIQHYTSLSYSWGRDPDGDASPSRTLIIDGGVLNITENLHDCLVRLRPTTTDQPLFIWIDAVCINQSDVAERNSQVSQMAQIYKKASALLVWLGEDHDGNSDELARNALIPGALWNDLDRFPNDATILKHLDLQQSDAQNSPLRSAAFHAGMKLAERSASWKTKKPGVLSRNASRDVLWPKLIHYGLAPHLSYERLQQHIVKIDAKALIAQTRANSSYIMDSLGREFWLNFTALLSNTVQAMAALCQRRYFHRRWIVQEVFHSRPEAAMIRWGPFSTDTLTFVKSVKELIDLLHYQEQPLRYLRARGWVAPGLDKIKESVWASCKNAIDVIGMKDFPPLRSFRPTLGGGRIILDWLRRYQDTSCSDERDRLYAFVSIGEQPLITVNYRLSAEDVYTDFTGRVVEQGGLGIVLELASWQHRNVQQRSKTVPSWALDFRHGLPEVALYTMRSALAPDKALKLIDSEKVRTSSPAKSLIFQAIVSPFTGVSEVLLEGIPDLQIGDVACKIIQRREFEAAFVLRPLHDSDNGFILLGGWGNDSEMEPYIGPFAVQTITLY